MKNTPVSSPSMPRNLWAVLLAGGDGTRLRELTTRIVGDDRPKQFCPIVGGDSLLRQTRSRVDPLFSADRQIFVVSRAHETYYRRELADAENSVVIAQPVNRGTAVGIIFALIRVMQSDPDAVVALFPCDQHYSDDESFRWIVRSAVAGAEQFPESVVIVGAEAEYAETEYGWIEPGRVVSQAQVPLCRVNRFWEKPALSQALSLLHAGCLWNTFVTVGNAATLFELLCSEVPEVVLSVTDGLVDEDQALAYAGFPRVDFSRDILAHNTNKLLVVRDSVSGWVDLGSPGRVLDLLARNLIRPTWVREAHGFSLHDHSFGGRV